MSPPTRLLLVRHGQIEANLSKVWHGSTDSPLTELGHDQARRVGAFLARAYAGAAALYTSPLRRCRDTAAAIASRLDLEPRAEPGLAEYGIGELEGTPYRALLEDHKFFERIHADPDYAPAGGESPRQVLGRFVATVERIALAHPGELVVAVTHGAASAIGLAHLVENDAQAWHGLHSSNCGVTELELGAPARIVHFDQTDHLDRDPDPLD